MTLIRHTHNANCDVITVLYRPVMLITYANDLQITRRTSIRLATYRSRVRVLPRHHCAVALHSTHTCVPLSPSSIAWYRSKDGDALRLGRWPYRSGDALAMCHSLCGLSTYGLKAHVREMSTPHKLTIGNGQPLPFLQCRIGIGSRWSAPNPIKRHSHAS